MDKDLSFTTVTDTHWTAIANRDSSYDGCFVFGVATTGIYCRPSCPSRRARREHIRLFSSPSEARASGFRACLRCAPDAMAQWQRHHRAIEQACDLIAKADLESEGASVDLARLSRAAGLSPRQFHRLFKKILGLTPKDYVLQARADAMRKSITSCDRMIYSSVSMGYESLSGFYSRAVQSLGMSPGRYRAGGVGEVLVYAQSVSELGFVSAAFSARGVCAVHLGDDPSSGLSALCARFPRARFVAATPSFLQVMSELVARINESRAAEDLPLDIRGTAFQARVWGQLRKIKPGSTQSYGSVAQSLDMARGHRAVARACAQNRIAALVPCHRVLRSDGSLGGYAWGLERKSAMLARERALTAPPDGTGVQTKQPSQPCAWPAKGS